MVKNLAGGRVGYGGNEYIGSELTR